MRHCFVLDMHPIVSEIWDIWNLVNTNKLFFDMIVVGRCSRVWNWGNLFLEDKFGVIQIMRQNLRDLKLLSQFNLQYQLFYINYFGALLLITDLLFDVGISHTNFKPIIMLHNLWSDFILTESQVKEENKVPWAFNQKNK